MQELSTRSVEDLVTIRGISQITARRIVAWFESVENRELVASLTATWGCDGSPPRSLDAQVGGDPADGAGAASGERVRIAGVELLAGDSFVATGTVPGATRADIEAWYARKHAM